MNDVLPDDPTTSDPLAPSPREFLTAIAASENIAADLDEGKLAEIAQQVLADHDLDKGSMSEWRSRMEKGIELATLVKEERTYPFNGAANIRYPLVTSAALQFNARAYPAIVPPDRVVKARTFGEDPRGEKAARAERIGEHMSWQLTHEIDEWEAETDRLLVMLPIVGSMVRKWWSDPATGRPRCRLVDPGRFVVNDKVKTLRDAPRCGEEIDLYPGEIETRVRKGLFLPITRTETEDDQASECLIEQHTRLDLDEDGYDEPYVVTVHRDTQTVVRIVADFGEEDVTYQTEMRTEMASEPVFDPVMGAPLMDAMTGQPMMREAMVQREVEVGVLEIRRGSHFVHFPFMPAMDGGFHGTGLGLLLGDISEAINSIISMQLDAGHYATLGGGFIGSRFRMKGGGQRLRPGEWKMVEVDGNTVRESIVPMTLPKPDGTLFQLLGLLIDAGREIASVKDTMTGEQPRQQQTATTTLALIEQGQMVFTAAYKRIFRSLREEYRLLARMNAQGVTPQAYAAFLDDAEAMHDPAQDYDLASMDVAPVADPRSVTKMQEAAKAQVKMELANAGRLDPMAATRDVIEAMDLGDPEQLIPKPDPIAAQMGQMQIEMAQTDLAQKRADLELTLAKINAEMAQATENMADAEATAAKTRLEPIKMMLEERRDALDRAIRRGSGGVAGAPGHAGPAPRPGPPFGAPESGLPGGLLAGAPGL